jgi:Ca2+-binding RTX toxin-like protein
MANFTGTASDDNLAGTSGPDIFDLTQGGSDTAQGLGGTDQFQMGGTLDATDRIDGGDAFDTVILDGDYTRTLHLGAGTLQNIEQVTLSDGHDYRLVFADGNVAAGDSMFVEGDAVSSGHNIYVSAAAETDGLYTIDGGSGNNTLIGGGGDHTIDDNGGTNVLRGGAGDDDIADAGTGGSISGGAGSDRLVLDRTQIDSSFDFAFHPGRPFTLPDGTHVAHVESLSLDLGDGDHHFVFKHLGSGSFDSVSVTGGQSTVLIDFADATAGVTSSRGFAEAGGSSVTYSGMTPTLIGSAFDDTLEGNANADTLIGGAGHNTFWGFEGGDTMVAGHGRDDFRFARVTDSSSVNFDTIVDFDADHDFLFTGGTDFPRAPSIVGGHLSNATFDSDLAAAVNRSNLGAIDMALFRPSSGDYAGQIFLVINENGEAGYQANQDIVIRLEHPHHLSDLSAANTEG